jgi:hypothetical protein
MTTPTIPAAYQGIVESIARSMREHPELYAHLNTQTETQPETDELEQVAA